MARRINNKKLDKSLEAEVQKELLKEFGNIKSYNELDIVLNKFMTAEEKKLLFRRIAVMNLINRGKKYREITEMLEISDNTISNVVDLIRGRGYGRNPNRKIIYSKYKDYRKKKRKPLLRKYKGAESII